MMQPKDRVARGGVSIDSHATHGEVTTCVHPVEGLELVVETGDIRAVTDDCQNVRRSHFRAVVWREIAAQTAWVVTQSIVRALGFECHGTEGNIVF